MTTPDATPDVLALTAMCEAYPERYELEFDQDQPHESVWEPEAPLFPSAISAGLLSVSLGDDVDPERAGGFLDVLLEKANSVPGLLTALAAATAAVARLENENAMLLAVVDAARVYIHAADALSGDAELVGWYNATDAAGLER